MASQENECNPVVAAAGPQGNKAVKFRTGFCVLEIAPPRYERLDKLLEQEEKDREAAEKKKKAKREKEKASQEEMKKRREAMRDKWIRDHPVRPGKVAEDVPPILQEFPEFEEAEEEEAPAAEPPPAIDYHNMPNEYLAGMIAKPLQEAYVALLTAPHDMATLMLARTDKEGNLVRIERNELGGPIPSGAGRTVLFEPDRTYWYFWSYDRELFESNLSHIGQPVSSAAHKHVLFSFQARRCSVDVKEVEKFLEIKSTLDRHEKKEEMNRLATLLHNLRDGMGLLTPRAIEDTNRRSGEPQQPPGTNFKGSKECDSWVYARRPGIAATFLAEYVSNVTASIYAESAWGLQQIRTAHRLVGMADRGESFPALDRMIKEDIKQERIAYWTVLQKDTRRYVEYAKQCSMAKGYVPGKLFSDALPDLSNYTASPVALDGTQEFFELDQSWKKAADYISSGYYVQHPTAEVSSQSSSSVPSYKRKNWKPLSPRRRAAVQGYFDYYQYAQFVMDGKRPEYRNDWYRKFADVDKQVEQSGKVLQDRAREFLERAAPAWFVWLDIAWHVKGVGGSAGPCPPSSEDHAAKGAQSGEGQEKGGQDKKGEGAEEPRRGARASLLRAKHIDEPRLVMHARYFDAAADVGHKWWEGIPEAGSPEFELPTYREAIKKGFENTEKMSELLKAWFEHRSSKYMAILEKGLQEFGLLTVKMTQIGDQLLGTPLESVQLGEFTFSREVTLTTIEPGGKPFALGPTAETFPRADGSVLVRQNSLVIKRGEIAMNSYPYMASETSPGSYSLELGAEIKAGKSVKFERLKGTGEVYSLSDGVLRRLTPEELERLHGGTYQLSGRAELYENRLKRLVRIEPGGAALENQELFKKIEEDCKVSLTRVPRFMIAFATTALFGFALWEFVFKKNKSTRDVFELTLSVGTTVQTLGEACEVFRVRLAGSKLAKCLMGCGSNIGKLLGPIAAGWEVVQVFREGTLVLFQDAPYNLRKGRINRCVILRAKGIVLLSGGSFATIAMMLSLVPAAGVILAIAAVTKLVLDVIGNVLGEYQSFMDTFDKNLEVGLKREVVTDGGRLAWRGVFRVDALSSVVAQMVPANVLA